MKRFLGDAEQISHLFDLDQILILGEVVFEGHKMGGLLEAEAEFLSNEEEVIVVDFVFLGVFKHDLYELPLEALVLAVLA